MLYLITGEKGGQGRTVWNNRGKYDRINRKQKVTKRGIMGKSLYIAEKPSVAQEFARVLNLQTSRDLVRGASGDDELSGGL